MVGIWWGGRVAHRWRSWPWVPESASFEWRTTARGSAARHGPPHGYAGAAARKTRKQGGRLHRRTLLEESMTCPRTKGMIAAAMLAAGAALPSMAAAQRSADIAALKQSYRRPPPLPVANPALAELGRELFFEPQISASGQSTCAGCHYKELGWAVTDAKSRNDSGKLTSRKSQPLIGIGHLGQAPVGWDGRNASLE